MIKRGKLIRTTILAILVAICSLAEAQVLDTLHAAYHRGHRLIGGLAGKRSILSGEPVRIYQVFGGLDYSEVFRVYWGYNFMPQPVSETQIDDRYTSRADTMITHSNISYLSLGFEYAFYRKKKWKLSVPIQAGFGVNRIRRYNVSGEPLLFTDRAIYPLETGVNAIYYFNRWLGVKSGIGIRFTGGDQVLADLSGPYYNLGIAVFFGEIYKMIF